MGLELNILMTFPATANKQFQYNVSQCKSEKYDNSLWDST